MRTPSLPRCHAIVLVAGAGRRFGGGKLTTCWRGRPLVAWAVETALAAPVERVTVVTGCGADAVEAALAPWCCDRLTFLRTAQWSEGMGRSLSDGVASLPPDWTALLVVLGDMPAIPSHLGAAFLLGVLGGAPAALPSFEGRDGHPVALSRTFWDRHGPTTGDAGLRRALASQPGVLRLPTQAGGVRFDIDSPADLDRLPQTHAGDRRGGRPVTSQAFVPPTSPLTERPR
ncbi:nucleotidyltransferase family protein [Rubellimicrobium roseum]|uniref:Nucleotidyltransferase family protein n=1 Tax=Rubellimicrobium roseum TaxID=687525 RepID=A0A5C4N3T6_9RHOB|nr:nucleotidyltransferase family protein [Rubellimicrobium roseum]TNC61103.1 nucleotidyltransferase family protein [Rubellimicrobium roseum]